MRESHRHRTFAVAVAALAAGVMVGGLQVTRAAEPGTATSVVPVEPYRILDTRLGTGAPAAPLGAGQTIDVQVAGVGPVPADAVGVVLNITGTRTTATTYITAWPTGGLQPTASVLNLTPGIDAPNGVTALLGTGGKLSLFNFTGSTDLIADVAGYLVPAEPESSGPELIDTTVPISPDSVTLGEWEGVVIKARCNSTASAVLRFEPVGSGNGIKLNVVAVVGGTLAPISDTTPHGTMELYGASSQHVTGIARNVVAGGAPVQIDLHIAAASPCQVIGTVEPLG